MIIRQEDIGEEGFHFDVNDPRNELLVKRFQAIKNRE